MSVFRKVALERLSSPEQLDQLLQVTRPSGWLALGSLAALLVAALVWGFAGSIPTEARGGGMLLRRGGVSDLVSAASGQVEELLVAVGDPIAKGQVVARIRQDSLSRQIEEARARKGSVASEYEDLLRFAEKQRRLSAQNLVQQRANLERSIATLERQGSLLEERIAAQRELLGDGLITRQTLLATEQELNQTWDQLAAQRLELNGLALKRLEGEQALEQQIEARRGQLRDLDLEIRELTGTLEENIRVASSGAGRVLELAADRGDVVSPGSVILTMEVNSEELMAVLFVPASEGKQVRPGMAVKVSPSNVQREDHGFMLGTVRWVAEYPTTSRGMLRLLGNQELVDRLLEQGPPIQVDVALVEDPSTPTGYRWSSSTGPDLEITSGTLAVGRILLDEDRPIAFLLPKVRSALGS
jgi:HlyD family secretion protein